MVASGIVSGIIFAWFLTNVVASPEKIEKIELPPETTKPSNGMQRAQYAQYGREMTDINVRKNNRNVGLYDATERNTQGMLQNVGDLQIEQAIRQRDHAKLDSDGMPNVERPKILRS